MEALNSFVIIKPDSREKQTESGLVYNDNNKVATGTIMSLSIDEEHDNGLTAGEKVLFKTDWLLEYNKLVIVDYSDIIARL